MSALVLGMVIALILGWVISVPTHQLEKRRLVRRSAPYMLAFLIILGLLAVSVNEDLAFVIEAPLFLCLVLVLGAPVGVLGSVPALIPVLRRRAVDSRGWRRGLIMVQAVLVYALLLLAISWLYATLHAIVSTVREPISPNDIQREIWLRFVLSPDNERCYMDDTHLCRFVTDYMAHAQDYDGSFTDSTWLGLAIWPLYAAGITALSTRWITRGRRKPKHDNFL